MPTFLIVFLLLRGEGGMGGDADLGVRGISDSRNRSDARAALGSASA